MTIWSILSFAQELPWSVLILGWVLAVFIVVVGILMRKKSDREETALLEEASRLIMERPHLQGHIQYAPVVYTGKYTPIQSSCLHCLNTFTCLISTATNKLSFCSQECESLFSMEEAYYNEKEGFTDAR